MDSSNQRLFGFDFDAAFFSKYFAFVLLTLITDNIFFIHGSINESSNLHKCEAECR